MPVFVVLKFFTNADPVVVNMSDVQTMTPIREEGCTITFKNGRKVSVKENMDTVLQLFRQRLEGAIGQYALSIETERF